MKHNRKAGALCAVMFLLSWLLPLSPTAAAVDPVDPGDVYAVDIEFGSLAFYYDYGIWNVNTMRYEAAETSSSPAQGTTPGFPGWYGFDEKANLIKVVNGSLDDSITVEFTYAPLTAEQIAIAKASKPDGEWDALQPVSGVSMTVVNTDTGVLWEGNAATIPAGDEAAGFVQLDGTPMVNGERYNSEDMLPIGMFTMTIKDPQ